ncbi:centromere protein S [Nephila pilipes]|uniref:Centromere protein S n=1 Tax=Nephila pilipes TaxID=299642 RepID=A0A8X6NUY0_NEPPI|nr:centromere protein S [Nephila pilipes]
MEDLEKGIDLEEKLQTSVHYAVGKICTDAAESFKVQFSKEFIASVADLAFRQAGIFAEDLEAFAKHAKRSTVNTDDVKLLARRSESLHDHINKMATELAANSIKAKNKKKKTDEEPVVQTIDID